MIALLKVIFYVGHQIHIDQSSTMNANMYALQEIHFKKNTVATDFFVTSGIHVEEGSIINFDSGFVSGTSSTHHDDRHDDGHDHYDDHKSGY